MKTCRIAFAMRLIVATGLIAAVGLGAQSTPPKPETPGRPWTILLYGAVDNNADDPFVNFTDKVRRAIDDDPGIELIMFIDRSDEHEKKPTFLGDDFSSSRLYRVRKDSVERLSGGAHFPEITKDSDVNVNSADATTLQRFIAWGKANYPAQRYGLLIYSHADGRTMCPDERSRANMGIAETTAEISAKERVDFLALELCNMGGIEVAYQWRPGNGRFEADVLVAIPNAGPPLDWDRAFARIRSPGHASTAQSTIDPATMTAAQFGTLVIEEGLRGRTLHATGRSSRESAGCYDLHKVSDVKKAIDALAVALARCNCKNAIVELRSAGALTPSGPLMAYSEDGAYVDAYELCRRVEGSDRFPEAARSAATEVMKQLRGFMLASFGMSGYAGFEAGKHGVSIVLPSGTPNCWKHYRWYTPVNGPAPHYGDWAFLKDGATSGNGTVENWFELMESWFKLADEKVATAPSKDSQTEVAKLQGDWKMVALEVLGMERNQLAADFRLTIKGDEWTITNLRAPARVTSITTKIDSAANPKALEMTEREGDRERTALGIYKLEGDTLTLRRTTASGDVLPPREFKTSGADGMLAVWERVKK